MYFFVENFISVVIVENLNLLYATLRAILALCWMRAWIHVHYIDILFFYFSKPKRIEIEYIHTRNSCVGVKLGVFHAILHFL